MNDYEEFLKEKEAHEANVEQLASDEAHEHALRAAREEGRKEQFEKDCGLMCHNCESGNSPVPWVGNEWGFKWRHDFPEGYVGCPASPLHEAARLAGGEG